MKNVNIALAATHERDYVMIKPDYLNSVWNSGGIPTVLPPRTDAEFIDQVVSEFDGFLFCGGVDIDPKYYGEEINGAENICSVRDEFECALFKAAFKSGKPILGICRGMQVINVFLGGSLHQHVDGHLQSEERSARTHSVTLSPDGLLSQIESDEVIEVNTFHHQIVKKLADGLVVDGVSTHDGYIEAYHHADHKFLLGVQWHPEDFFEESETSRRIFEAFVESCREG